MFHFLQNTHSYTCYYTLLKPEMEYNRKLYGRPQITMFSATLVDSQELNVLLEIRTVLGEVKSSEMTAVVVS